MTVVAGLRTSWGGLRGRLGGGLGAGRPAASGLALVVMISVLGVALGPKAAYAQVSDEDVELGIDVRGTTLQPDGTSELVVNVTGLRDGSELEAATFRIFEDGTEVDTVEVDHLVESAADEIAVVLSIDISGSMQGDPLDAVKRESTNLVRTLTAEGIAVGLHAFANEVREIEPPSTDTDRLVAAIDGLTTEQSTALFDAVTFGVQRLDALDTASIRSLIVLADGQNNASDATLVDAIDAAADRAIPVTVIAFESGAQDLEALRPLAADTGGRFLTATDAAQLTDVFLDVATDVTSQVILTYEPAQIGGRELEIGVEVALADRSARTGFLIANPRIADEARVPPSEVEFTDPGILGSPVTFYSALGVAFVAALLLLLAVFLPRGDARVARTLASGLTMVQRVPRNAPRVSGMSASAIGRRALEVIEAVPTPAGYTDRLQEALDRAGWAMRASEFRALRYAITLGLGLFTWVLSRQWWLAVIALVAGVLLPRLVLDNAISRRRRRFMEGLPDTLQLLSGTLRAGYGILQGIDTVVKESEAPMSTEFSRVLLEARLGLELEDSLSAMAERIDDDDFRWVVVAISIQRRVGGNLAELLDTVADTLRGREQVRRQVEVLSAEGRLSAAVLIALPFVILLYLLITNPTYLTALFTTTLGRSLIGGAAVLVVVGVIWMRRMIRIQV